jgi:aspartate-semialdehyde dehydrogenase
MNKFDIDNAENRRQRLDVALVGASSLLGKEIKQVIQERHVPLGRLAQIDAPELGGQLTDFDDEPAFIQPLDKDVFEDIAVAIFASSANFTRNHWQQAKDAGCDIVDASFALTGEDSARLWSPSLEYASTKSIVEVPSRLIISGHPAAMALAHVFLNLAKISPMRRSVVTVFEPVSERGQAGVDELHQQTLKLLAFQPVPTAVFDSQVAFNILSRYGADATANIREIEDRIVSNLTAFLGPKISPPSLRLLQVPIFHGTAFHCFVELERTVGISEMEDALRSAPISVSLDESDSPSVVSAAGSNEIQIGRIEKDRACESGYWIWGAIDNLRFSAWNVVDILERLLLARAQAPIV